MNFEWDVWYTNEPLNFAAMRYFIRLRYKGTTYHGWQIQNNAHTVQESVDKALIPISTRLAIGTKIYFTQNIGAHVELGVFGGGLIQFGLSAKF